MKLNSQCSVTREKLYLSPNECKNVFGDRYQLVSGEITKLELIGMRMFDVKLGTCL